LGIAIASLFRAKAARWKSGRKDLFENLPRNLDQCVWIHCASLGEFEQGRPLIEALRENDRNPILLTFFSPSGYEVRKDYPLVDAVSYLPLDTPKNAKRFLDTVNPEAAIFIKYEIWHNFFREAYARNIPVYLASAIFRSGQIYFRPYGTWFLETLRGVKCVFCQDQSSADLLSDHGIKNVVVSGDTRFDRVIRLAESSEGVTSVEEWLQGRRAVVSGSSWPEDDRLFASVIDDLPEGVAVIIAPHEITALKIERLKTRFEKADLLSENRSSVDPAQVLIIDSVGILGRLYRYAQFAHIGGGFGSGIHNTLEAAVYGIPVTFGPKHEKFREALGLKQAGGGFPIADGTEFRRIFFRLLEEDGFRNDAGKAAKNYVYGEAGATGTILRRLERDLQTELP
jgi:3-deoxy-D-manno-octulosonic-acid transferase